MRDCKRPARLAIEVGQGVHMRPLGDGYGRFFASWQSSVVQEQLVVVKDYPVHVKVQCSMFKITLSTPSRTGEGRDGALYNRIVRLKRLRFKSTSSTLTITCWRRETTVVGSLTNLSANWEMCTRPS